MRSLSTEEQEALAQLYRLRVWREKGDESEERIATQHLGFESVEHMYRQMKGWGWPDWVIYPEVSKRRRAWGKDPTADEVPITDYMGLFEEGVQKLNEALEKVPYLKQWLKDGRFVSQLHYPKESGRFQVVYRKEHFPEAYQYVWEARCKRYGYDPDKTEVIEVPREHVSDRGADRHPDSYLIWLIAAYALTGGTLPALPKVEEKRKALRLAAKQLATALLGGRTGAGAPLEHISGEEQENARLVQFAARRGAVSPDGAVIDKEKWLPPEMWDCRPAEIRRLLSLRLPAVREGDD